MRLQRERITGIERRPGSRSARRCDAATGEAPRIAAQHLARVLGISQYLWETFLRSRQQELFPLLVNADDLPLRECRDSLRLELDQLVDGAHGAAAWAALNEFKDRHLFRIDMRHVLGHCRPFGAFSEGLTELAELVVSKALELAWLQEANQWGLPSESDGRTPARWMVAALGKFGGVEMGFASDLELMLVYSDTGRTSGTSSLATSDFFDRMMNAVASGIVAPQDGIFHVHLRMRPFGQAGAASVRLEDFRNYYRAEGPAWPYERQALVRLRPGKQNFYQKEIDVVKQPEPEKERNLPDYINFKEKEGNAKNRKDTNKQRSN